MRGKHSVTNTIERSFSGSGNSLARVIGKQTFTGKRRGTAKKKNKAVNNDGAEACPQKMVTRGGGADEVTKGGKVQSWAGTRKRKGETKKSAGAKNLLHVLFDIAAPDAEQNEDAMAFLLDARGKRELRLPNNERRMREEESVATVEEPESCGGGGGGEGVGESLQFQTVCKLREECVGLLVNVYVLACS